MKKSGKQIKWYEWKEIGVRSPLVRSFDKSIGCRIGLAITISYFAILIVNRVEHWTQGKVICPPQMEIHRCLTKELLSIIAVSNIEGFGILSAAMLYILESKERRQKAIYEAWQVLDNAAAAGVPSSPARYKAIEDLNNYQVSFEGLYIPGADLKSINLENANLAKANLSKAILSRANLSNANLNRAQLQGINLSGANLQGADLRGANFQETDLRGATLEDTDCKGATFREAQLAGANLEKGNFWRADFSKADLREARLSNAQLKETHFEQSSLIGADLRNADFEGAFLAKAKLRSAKLTGANLKEVNLKEADLQNACLIRANLKDANLQDANLRGADLRYAIKLELSQLQSAHNYTQIDYDPKLNEQMQSDLDLDR